MSRRRLIRVGWEWRLPQARFNNDGTENDLDASAILQEIGDDILTETGDRLLQE